MAKKQQPRWQFKFTFGLSIVMFFLIFAYFVQSFQDMREIKPVSVAVERIGDSSAKPTPNTKDSSPEESMKEGTGK
ncbi:hypothetical protein ACFL17_05840 [Pseudomonadota bacterium]